MVDVLFTAGQVFSVIGLACGWLLSLTFGGRADEACAVREQTTLLHHLAMA